MAGHAPDGSTSSGDVTESPVPDRSDRSRTIATLTFFAFATTVLTWPLAFSAGSAVSIRGDYLLNLWNIWWVSEALTDPNMTIYWSDYLHYPVGVSLARHVLTPVSSIPGALLSSILDLHEVMKVLIWVHFWLSAWTFYLFARELTGTYGGAVLAGLFWSFSPFHFYYLVQMNVTTMEFLPLLGFFLVRSYREGGRANAIGVGVSAALLAASSSYYLVYGGMLGLLLLLGGRWWAPATPWRVGARRILFSAVLASLAVAAVSWRLLLTQPTVQQVADALAQNSMRASDLLGYRWVGGPEKLLISWPTMFGYSGIALIALGVRIERRRLFWLGLGAVFFIFSLGSELKVAGHPTGIPLPYALFSEIPVLWMLRKPDRIFAMVLFAASVLAAFGWREISARLKNPILSTGAWIAVAALLSIERAAIPLQTFPIAESSYLETLAANPDISSVVDLPHQAGKSSDARSNLLQTRHGKKIPQGYVVSLALGPPQHSQAHDWDRAYRSLSEGKDPKPSLDLARRDGIDALILRKTRPALRAPLLVEERTIWSPFFFVRQALIEMRQRGQWLELPIPESRLDDQRKALSRHLGPPAYEDDEIIVFLAGAN